jgi:hypothetical protein
MNSLSKIPETLSKKPFLVIFICVLTVGAAIFLIQNDWRSSLEKCADDSFAGHRFDPKYPKELYIKDLREKKIKNKIQDRLYLEYYSYCENQRKLHPETFKLKWGS